MSRRLWVVAALTAIAAAAVAAVLIPRAEPVRLHHWHHQTPVGFTLAGLQHGLLTAGSVTEINGEIATARSVYHANTIRLQITQKRLVHDPTYLSYVRAVTDYGHGLGLTMVLNAQTEPSPGFGWGGGHASRTTMRFWRIMVHEYANRPRIVFDLFNEPRNETWEQWQAETQPIVSMIRQHADNWIWANGLGWGSTLQGVPLLTGGRIVYTYHHPGASWAGMVPQTPGTWDTAFGYLAKSGHPVVDGEFTNGNGGNSRMSRPVLHRYLRYTHRNHIGMLVFGLAAHRLLTTYQHSRLDFAFL